LRHLRLRDWALTMKIFALTDADGRATGFYIEGFNPEIPDGAIEIDEATYRDWVENTTTRRWDGSALVPSDHPAPPPAPPPLSRDELLARANVLMAEVQTILAQAEATQA
ncbi:hypothetical protein, partial [Roseomonas xinghualingensis]|uniref:hypothetical protein n=2 Tax=Roseomonas xinghualingensis TaxID=2986475 RepID=UPI00366E0D76